MITSTTAPCGSSFGFVVQGLRESGQPAALDGFAAELVNLKVAVIRAVGPAAILAALAATRVIPIVALDHETEPVLAGCSGLLGIPLVGQVHAQSEPKVARTGFLSTGTAASFTWRTDAMKAGLSDLGYVEGKDLAIADRVIERLVGTGPGARVSPADDQTRCNPGLQLS